MLIGSIALAAVAALGLAQTLRWDSLIAGGDRAVTDGRYAGAVSAYGAALAELGGTTESDPRRLAALHRLAVAHTFRGDYAEAEPLYREVISAAQRVEPKPPALFEALNDLGSLLRQVGRLAEAERNIRRAIEIAESRLGRRDPELARFYHNLGLVLSSGQKYAPAERAVKHALSLFAVEGAENRMMIAEATSTLAGIYLRRKRYRESAECYARALPVLEELRGPSHPVLIGVLTDLASLHLSLGSTGAAESVSRRALEISACALGEAHPLTANAELIRARVLAARAQTAEAERHFQQGLAVFEKSGARSAAYATSLQEYAKFLRAAKRSAEAAGVEGKAGAILALSSHTVSVRDLAPPDSSYIIVPRGAPVHMRTN